MNQNRRLADIAQSVVTAAGLDVARDQVVEARLEDRDFAALQGLDAVRILVDTDDRMAEFGETSAGYQDNIAGPDHSNEHGLIPYNQTVTTGRHDLQSL